jgi:predicted SnoaL-like aldol condensation-catalyzing enzyme
MALKKYKLENLPKDGQVKMEQGTGRAIILDPETITDEQCEALVGDGKDPNVNYYIKLVKEKPDPKDEPFKK